MIEMNAVKVVVSPSTASTTTTTHVHFFCTIDNAWPEY